MVSNEFSVSHGVTGVSFVPGRVDQVLPVSRQKSSNLPYRDMAGYGRSLALNGGWVRAKVAGCRRSERSEVEEGATVIGNGSERGNKAGLAER